MSDLHKIMPLDLAEALATHIRDMELSYEGEDSPSVFAIKLPDKPVNAIGVFVTGGPTPENNPMSFPAIQLHVRHDALDDQQKSRGHRIAGWYAQRLYAELHRSNFRSPDPNFWVWLVSNHLPGPWFYDHNQQPVWSLNFTGTGVS